MRASCRADDSTGTSPAAKPLNCSNNIEHRGNKSTNQAFRRSTKEAPGLACRTQKDGQVHTGTRRCTQGCEDAAKDVQRTATYLPVLPSVRQHGCGGCNYVDMAGCGLDCLGHWTLHQDRQCIRGGDSDSQGGGGQWDQGQLQALAHCRNHIGVGPGGQQRLVNVPTKHTTTHMGTEQKGNGLSRP